MTARLYSMTAARERADEREFGPTVAEDEPFIDDWRDAMAELRVRRGMQPIIEAAEHVEEWANF